jgi:hypothetical protein
MNHATRGAQPHKVSAVVTEASPIGARLDV